MTYIRLGFAAAIALIIVSLTAAMFYYKSNAISASAEAAQDRKSVV